MSDITKVAMAIVGLAIVATLVVNGQNTSKVIGAGGSAFSNAIGQASKG